MALEAAGPDRRACLCRELTKLHEEVLRAPLSALARQLAERSLRGEVTLVVGPGEPYRPERPERVIKGQKGAAEALAQAWDLPKREVYAELTRLKQRLLDDS